MKKILIFLLWSLSAMNVYASDMGDVKAMIKNYADYDNSFNAKGLEDITDENFHFMMHAKGDVETVTTIPRAAFLAGIEAKKFGGNNKALKIEQVNIQGNIANVYFTHKGEAAGFHHFMNLIKLNGVWKAASTAVHMEFYK